LCITTESLIKQDYKLILFILLGLIQILRDFFSVESKVDLSTDVIPKINIAHIKSLICDMTNTMTNISYVYHDNQI